MLIVKEKSFHSARIKSMLNVHLFISFLNTIYFSFNVKKYDYVPLTMICYLKLRQYVQYIFYFHILYSIVHLMKKYECIDNRLVDNVTFVYRPIFFLFVF